VEFVWKIFNGRFSMEFYVEYSMELPWKKFFVEIPRSISHGIPYRISTEFSYVFAQVELPCVTFST